MTHGSSRDVPDLDRRIADALAAHRAWWLADEAEEDDGALLDLLGLAQRGDARAADHVVDVGLLALGSNDVVERIFAVRLLREMHREAEVANALLAALRRERDVRALSWCVGGLGFRGTHEAVPDLAALVTHPDASLRYRLAGALSACALPVMGEIARDALLLLADDADADVRFSALYVLCAWWQHRGLRDELVRARLLRGASDDDDEGVRRTCREAFGAED